MLMTPVLIPLKTAPVVLVAIALAATAGSVAQRPPDTRVFYVDCGSQRESGNGLTPAAAWHSLEQVNATTFRPGDRILLRRATRCRGPLQPSGSGSQTAPVTIDAYGEGQPPVVDGGTHPAAVQLMDQSYWEIRNLEVTGGTTFGVVAAGKLAHTTLQHIYLSNLIVHDVYGDLRTKNSGLVVLSTEGTGQRIEDVVIDGVKAYNTTQWAGISIAGATWSEDRATLGANFVVRNSTVHDVGGDGIVVNSGRNVLVERNVAFETGRANVPSLTTPNAIWTWNCKDCVVQFNEAYLVHGPGTNDGGAFDSDLHNENVTIQYNYGHDADGYCVGLFAIFGPNTDTTVRYNVCANNGRDPEKAWQGDFYYASWNDGAFVNSRVYNNVSYWNPIDPSAPAVAVYAAFEGADSLFVNNIIHSTTPGMIRRRVDGRSGFVSDYNIYWSSAAEGWWQTRSDKALSLPAWQKMAGVDLHSIFADPRLESPTYARVGKPVDAFTTRPDSPARGRGRLLDTMGDRDFFGNALTPGQSVDIGSHQSRTSH